MALVAASMAAAAIGTGCEQIVEWEEDAGNLGDGGDGGGGDDGGQDAGPDAGPDAGMDAGMDAGIPDAGPVIAAYLASFGPDQQFLRSPADVSPTYPTPLMVGITRDGETGAVQVNIGSSDASVAGVTGGAVIIPSGSNSAVVPLTSREGGTVTLTATFDGGTLQATVTALPKLLLSEVAAGNGLVMTDDEFVEIYNPTAVSFSLAGYVVQYHSSAAGPYENVCTIPAGKRIAPYSFFLIGVNGFARAEDTHDNWAGTATFNGGNGTVRLGAPGISTAAGDPRALDRVSWGGSAVDPEGTPVSLGIFTFGSIERKATAGSTSGTMNGADQTLGNAYDSDNNSNDWVTQGAQDPQTSLASPEMPP
ncbi:MAG TPA: lamin tail domain-containing protein [Myxococcaceae bacterium]